MATSGRVKRRRGNANRKLERLAKARVPKALNSDHLMSSQRGRKKKPMKKTKKLSKMMVWKTKRWRRGRVG